jgi:photosystem II stability/assembly factor-like uncharacterized protein
MAFDRIYRTTDGGLHWHLIGPGELPSFAYRDVAFGTGSPSDIFILVDAGPYISIVDGTTEASFARPLDAHAGGVYAVAADIRHEASLLLAKDLGVFRSSDSGESWSDVSQGITGRGVSSIRVVNRTTMLADDQRTVDGGRHWSQYLTDEPPVDTAVDATNSRDLYAVTDTAEEAVSVWSSTDAGASWRRVADGVIDDPPIALFADPRLARVLYLVTFAGEWKSTDGGASWTAIDFSSEVRKLAVAPTTPPCLFELSDTWLQHTCDDGQSWTSDDLGPESTIFDVAVAPSDPRSVYVVSQADYDSPLRLSRSHDGGATYESIETPLPVATSAVHLAVDPRSASSLYLGFSAPGEGGGVLRLGSDDTWSDLSAGLFNRSVNAIQVDARARPRLIIATGSGVWTMSLGPAS